MFPSDFFNWNKVKIRYCDGASFAGHSQYEFKVNKRLSTPASYYKETSLSFFFFFWFSYDFFLILQNGTKLLFRGHLIWEALMDELLSIGLSNAKQVASPSFILLCANMSCFGHLSVVSSPVIILPEGGISVAPTFSILFCAVFIC